jgi:hypothetical protein
MIEYVVQGLVYRYHAELRALRLEIVARRDEGIKRRGTGGTMPDLVTHFCTAQIARRCTRLRLFPVFALGVILPDLISRPVHILFPATAWYVAPFHSPLVCALYCLLLSLLFAPAIRRACFISLCAGVGLHLVLDALQKQVCQIYYFWLFPFSWWTWEADLFWPDQAVLFLPVTIALTALVSMTGKRTRNRTPKDTNT